MASVQERPRTFFRLGPVEVGKARCFAVRRGDTKGNANALVLFSEHYGELKALSRCKYPIRTIDDMLSVVQDGLHGVRHYVPEGVPLLGVGNVTEDGIDLSEVNYITDEEHARLAASHVKRGDLLVTITGRLGTASVYDSDEPANLSAHVALCRAKPKQELLYLKYFLSSRFGAASLTSAQIGSTHPHINVRRLVQLPIPLPPSPVQEELVTAMEAARARRRTKLAEADELLAGLDGFLLSKLGLNRPPEASPKVFAATLAAARRRADADFHSPRFRAIREGIEGGIYRPRPLHELCSSFESGFAAGKQDQAFDSVVGVPHLRPLNFNADGDLSLETTKFVPRSVVAHADYCERGEVLFNNTNSAEMVGKSAVFEFEQPCACSNHVTRIRAREGVSPHYLAAIFNLFRRLGYFSLLATKFNNQAGINLDTLKPLRVPAPPLAVQEELASEVRRRRDEAHQLRGAAEENWQAARRWFEEQLLSQAKP